MGMLKRIPAPLAASSPDPWMEDALVVLREGASEIDATFAATGARFAEGLELFEGLNNRLVALSAEMSNTELAEARRSLESLVRQMPALEQWLEREKSALAGLLTLSVAIGRMFIELRSEMRLVSILTQRARIERAGIRGHALDLDSFGDEIVALSQKARQVIEDCARRHESVAALIGKAAAVQDNFERRFGHSLTTLAADLGDMLSELGERYARSGKAIDQMADHSRQVVAATTDAVMALQGGDNVRQRLEHSIFALSMADGGGKGLLPAVCSLQTEQLRATAQLMEEDCARVDHAIDILGKSTNRLFTAVRSFSGDRADASSSLVAELQAGLIKAAVLLRECDADRRTVDGVMTKLLGLLEGIEPTIASIRKSAVDICFLGTNAGLRASRLGETGRSLLVIARELMGAANGVEARARELLDTLPELLAAASALRDSSKGSADLAAFEAAVQRSMTAISQTGGRMLELIGQLNEEAGRFTMEIALAQRAFAAMMRHSGGFRQVAVFLGEAGGAAKLLSPDEQQEVSAVFRDRIYPSYSMAAEREIHRNVAARLGLLEPEPDARVVRAAEAKDFFELL